MKLALALLLLASLSCSAAEKVILYSQYDFAPFWQNGRGLTPDLAQALTQYSHGRYLFEVQILPRKRLDAILEQPDWQGVVPWVNPPWFHDEAKTRFIWSANMMSDADLIISNSLLKYRGPSSLYGKRLGGILGHRYAEIEQGIKDGKIFRDDAPNQESNLKKIQAGRVDVIFVAYSSWGALLQNTPNETRGLIVADQPRSVYQRQLLITPNNPALSKYLLSTVEALNRDPSWQQKLLAYGYQGFSQDR
jgi:polar amino acid transport system substrate-binding protein